MTSHSDKILVVGPSWVGDMVMAQSLFAVLKQRHPDSKIDVLAPAWSSALLERMPEVHQALIMPLAHGEFNLQARWELGRQLRAAHYQHAIVLPGSWKSALVPFFAHIPMRTGFLGEHRWGLLNDVRRLNKQRLPMTVQRFVALGLPKDAPQPPDYPLPQLQIDCESQWATCEKFRLNADDKILALCPGAEYGAAKRWPFEYFADVALHKIRQGWTVWIFGSRKDMAIAHSVNRLTDKRCVDLTGQTSLSEAMDLLALVDAVVSNDSGLMHVAAALGKKLIALYGSSDPTINPPLHPNATVLYEKQPCAPCLQRKCPLVHLECLTKLTPDKVLANIPD